MEKVNGKYYYTPNEVIRKTRNGNYSSLLMLVKDGFIDGAFYIENQTSWLIPKSVAENYIYIIDHKKEIIDAIAIRAKEVNKKYDISNTQICKGADVDISILSKIKNNKADNITYRTIYKLCKKSAGLRCKISKLVKLAKDSSKSKSADCSLVSTTDKTEQEIIKLERIISEQRDNLNWLRSEIDRLKFISKVSKRKLRKYNKLNKGGKND